MTRPDDLARGPVLVITGFAIAFILMHMQFFATIAILFLILMYCGVVKIEPEGTK